MDASAARACFVAGFSLHYADTFSQCGHFFGSHAIQKLSSSGINDSHRLRDIHRLWENRKCAFTSRVRTNTLLRLCTLSGECSELRKVCCDERPESQWSAIPPFDVPTRGTE